MTCPADADTTPHRSRWETSTTTPDAGLTRIRYSVRRPASPAKPFLVFSNGRTEWIEKYQDVLDSALDDPHVGIVLWDHRGQGASTGRRGHVDSYDDFGKDAARVIELATGGAPYSIVGHSMGCAITLYATLRGWLRPQALVLCAPLLRLPDHPMPASLSRWVSQLARIPGVGWVRTGAGDHARRSFERNVLTHDRDQFLRIRESPYPVPSPSLGWVRATFEMSDYIFAPENLGRLATPTLLIIGSEEKVVDARGFVEWATTARNCAVAGTPVQLVTIPGGFHELLAEAPVYRTKTLDHMRAFLARYAGIGS